MTLDTLTGPVNELDGLPPTLSGMTTPESETLTYQRVAHHLRDRIMSGELPGGANLPSKKDLAADFSVSMTTVESALDVLRREGLIISGQGKLSRVRPVRFSPQQRSAAARDNYGPDPDAGFEQQHGVIPADMTFAREYRHIVAPPRVAAALQLDPSAVVCERRWTHLIAGVAVQVSWSYLSAARFADTILTDINEPVWPGGTVAQLESLGVHIDAFRFEIVTRQIRPIESALLEMDRRAYVQESFRVQYARSCPIEAAVKVVPPHNVQVFDMPLLPKVNDA